MNSQNFGLMSLAFVTKFMLFCIILQSCYATILVRFGKVSQYYFRQMKKGLPGGYDPLDDLDLQARQILCDAVIQARQFIFKYNEAYYHKQIIGNAKITLTDWETQDGTLPNTVNYQRFLPSMRSSTFDDLLSLDYQEQPVRVSAAGYYKIKMLRCASSMTTKWFVGFGFAEHVMYLFELSQCKSYNPLRVTGLFEPSAIIDDDVDPEYFYSQIRTSKKLMESICDIGYEDELRLCGAALDILSARGRLEEDIPQLSYVYRNRRRCITKGIKVAGDDETVSTSVRRCTIAHPGRQQSSTLLYVLADIRERGAIFVFLPAKGKAPLEFHAHVRKIDALLNPYGPKEVKLSSGDDSMGLTRISRAAEDTDIKDVFWGGQKTRSFREKKKRRDLDMGKAKCAFRNSKKRTDKRQ